MNGTCSKHGGDENCIQICGRKKSGRKRTLERHCYGWKDSIQTDFKETVFGVVDMIKLVQRSVSCLRGIK
jgi:hypothetical protein